MLDVPVFGHVGTGRIVHLGGDQSVYEITLSKVGIAIPAELAIASGSSVILLGFPVHIHEREGLLNLHLFLGTIHVGRGAGNPSDVENAMQVATCKL